ncbi:DNA alkylation repair protein [Gracilimonas mengyeensis]|uniref:3-methyladenine DNA glycosylase AlkD n=1 Tax=Gracilimonas mengyeensis TaxID=1302730 RepID=A0A521F6G4_9BACT|nr:DNA alkylation repair protein [Gracilimonas mengyeensis]SMO91684.1 3-methyladenine DNA glycosylase AlkD [Gracilimonas mengyeensis]
MIAQQVITDLKAKANPEKAKHSQRFFKTGPGEYGEGDRFLGINVPEQRKIAKKYRALPTDEVAILLQHSYHEVRLTAAYLLVYKVEKGDENTLKEVVDCYLDNLSGINNWDLVDSSCHQILGRRLQDKDRRLLYDFAQTDDLWKKRIAMITCYHFIKQKDFDDALAIAEILLNDGHDLIHKAVGWMLREIGNRDLDTEEAFLKKHYQNMPRTMLRYAIEKFDEPLRQKYLKGEI